MSDETSFDPDTVVEAIKLGLLDDSPTELKKLVCLVALTATDYRKAINEGVKKRGTSARKSLGDIHKLSKDMRKIILDSRKDKVAE